MQSEESLDCNRWTRETGVQGWLSMRLSVTRFTLPVCKLSLCGVE